MAVGYGYRPATKLIVDGHSFAYTPAWATAFPNKLLALLPSLYRMDVVALSATTYSQRATTAAARFDSRIPITDKCVMIDCGGFVDIWQSGGNLSASAALTAMESYWDNRKTAGVDHIIACTITPTTNAWLDSDGETQRGTLNTSIKASSHIDAYADIAGLAHAADPSNATYYYDGLHPTETLASEFATLVETALATLGLPT